MEIGSDNEGEYDAAQYDRKERSPPWSSFAMSDLLPVEGLSELRRWRTYQEFASVRAGRQLRLVRLNARDGAAVRRATRSNNGDSRTASRRL